VSSASFIAGKAGGCVRQKQGMLKGWRRRSRLTIKRVSPSEAREKGIGRSDETTKVVPVSKERERAWGCVWKTEAKRENTELTMI
jgi:hypothetical protein